MSDGHNLTQESAIIPDLASLFSDDRVDNELHYSSKHVVDVLGRDREQRLLRAFLENDPRGGFRWLQIAGAGGQGKSRLAFDLIAEARHEYKWDAGFLSEKGLIEFKNRWSRWHPSKPTLIVIDYVLGREKIIAPAFQALTRRHYEFGKAVRLLFVERQRWDRGGLERRRMPSGSDGIEPVEFLPSEHGKADWFRNLCTEISTDAEHIMQTRFGDGIIELKHLEPDHLVSLVEQIAKRQGWKVPASKDKIQEVLARVDNSGRPLFAYLLARRLANGLFDEGWTREHLLTAAIEREQSKRWAAVYSASGYPCPSPEDDVLSMRIARLATMIEGYDNTTDIKKLEVEEWPRPNRQTLEEALILVDAPRGNGVPLAGYIPPMQPDLLGEWFVLWGFTSDLVDLELITRAAWSLRPDKMAAFLQRCAQDFPEDDRTLRLLNIAPPNDDAFGAYAAVASSIFIRLIETKSKIPDQLQKALQIACERKDFRAINLNGYCYGSGVFSEKKPELAFRCFKDAAEAGDIGGMFNLGHSYRIGDGVKPDLQLAKFWWRKAANAGEINATFNLGFLISQEDGGEAKTLLAIQWYRKAAEMGHRDAMNQLGTIYLSGIGIKADPKEAVKWFLAAADAGHGAAMCNMGLCYLNGLGVESNLSRSKEWWLKAAALGFSAAMFNLGLYYQKGIEGSIDMQEAVAWWHRAAEAGHTPAMYNLGACFQSGLGVPKNNLVAVEWFRKAAKAGDINAANILSKLPVDIEEIRPKEKEDRVKLLADVVSLNPPGTDPEPDENRISQVAADLEDVPWALEPLIGGIWTVLTGQTSYAAIRLLFRFPSLAPRPGRKLVSIRSTKLSFYPGSQLIETLIDEGTQRKIACLVKGESGWGVALNGSSNQLHYLKEFEYLQLDTPRTAEEYLRFFCMAVSGPCGHFRIIDQIDRTFLYKRPEDGVIERISPLVQPPFLTIRTQKIFSFSCAVQHANALFHADFTIERESLGWQVKMQRDNRIASNLPFYAEGFDGFFRFRRPPDQNNLSSLTSGGIEHFTH